MLRSLSMILAFSLLVAASALSQEVGSKAPGFSLKTNSGQTIDLAKLKGKVVVVNFWATWCPPCRAEIPDFIDTYKNYKSKGLEIVGIALDENGWQVVKPFVERMKMNYPVVLGDQNISNAYGGIEAIPTTFIIDRKGNIALKHVGYYSQSAFEKDIKPLL